MTATEVILSLAAVLAATASAIAAWLAYSVARRAMRWQKEQVAPRVIVRTMTSEDSPSFIYIRIENTGQGPAYEVTFDYSDTLFRSFGLSTDNARPPQELQPGALASGIPALAPGDYRIILWGQYGGLHSVIGDGFVRIKAIYKDENQRTRTTLNLIEVKSYEFTDASDNRPTTLIGNELKKTRELLRTAIKSGSFIVENRKDYNLRHEVQRQRSNDSQTASRL